MPQKYGPNGVLAPHSVPEAAGAPLAFSRRLRHGQRRAPKSEARQAASAAFSQWNADRQHLSLFPVALGPHQSNQSENFAETCGLPIVLTRLYYGKFRIKIDSIPLFNINALEA